MKSEVYEIIKNQIITRELEPGQVLSEKKLMATYNIGRTPLREVLMALKQDGLVNIISRYGTFVTPLDLRDFRDVMEIRMHNELLVADLACERINTEQLTELKTTVTEAHELLDSIKDLEGIIGHEERENLLKNFWMVEERFHNLLYTSTANVYLIDIMKRLSLPSIRFWYYSIENADQMKKQFHDFEDIYDAIKDKDKQRCRDLLKRHIELSIQQMMNKS